MSAKTLRAFMRFYALSWRMGCELDRDADELAKVLGHAISYREEAHKAALAEKGGPDAAQQD